MVSTQMKRLDDLIAGRNCPLCGSVGQAVHYPNPFNLRTCCGILLSWQWESEEQYEQMYTDGTQYHKQAQLEGGQQTYWDRDDEALMAANTRIDTLIAIQGGNHRGMLLDIGTATGAFPTIAKLRGYDAYGTEPNEYMVKAAQQRCREVQYGTWHDDEYGNQTYDVITMHDVFEHLTYPSACLEKMHDRLTDSGMLVIEMPEFLCRDSILDGLNWKHVRPHQHVALYSESAADLLFDNNEYDVVAKVRPLRGKLGKICYYLQQR